MSECIFCKIVDKQIPAQVVYEDEQVMAFKDIRPVAPIHILVIPKKHISDLTQLTAADTQLAGHIQVVAVKVAQEMGLGEKGFRLVCNCKEHGGQVVYHLHYHLLGGKPLPTIDRG